MMETFMYTCTVTPNAQLYKSSARNFETLSLPSMPYITAKAQYHFWPQLNASYLW
jgi:hypothetical protein